METKQFKTNIMGGSCVEKVTPVFNETFGENNWKVDSRKRNQSPLYFRKRLT
jgi:hypothetical protein